jgi:hypothetical protein
MFATETAECYQIRLGADSKKTAPTKCTDVKPKSCISVTNQRSDSGDKPWVFSPFV